MSETKPSRRGRPAAVSREHPSHTLGAIVVGGGAAGLVAALGLARRGVDTALVAANEQVLSYDALLTSPVITRLAELDVTLPETATHVDGLLLGLGGAQRALQGLGAAACDRQSLDLRLLEAARSAGVQIIPGRLLSIQRRGGEYAVVLQGSARPVHASHVVFATGAKANGPGTRRVWAQRYAGTQLDEVTVLALAPPGAIAMRPQPTCAWAVPGDGAITVGIFTADAEQGADASLQAARQLLLQAAPFLSYKQPLGPLLGGWVDTMFSPERLSAHDGILVGDAAGLVNPFSGEGLSYAMQSGAFAAEAIAAHPASPVRAQAMYVEQMTTTFVGYFETARHAARRHHLAWRVLAAGAKSEHPFLAKGRRAVLLPEGLAGVAAVERASLSIAELAVTAPFMAACDEVSIGVIREEWPFLARLAVGGGQQESARVRPAVLVLAGLLSTGQHFDPGHARVGAAIELTSLGMLAFLGPVVAKPLASRGVDWAQTVTVLAGDFLLAQAARLVADAAPDLSWSFADWLAEFTALRSGRVGDSATVPAEAAWESLFEFPARIGGQLGGADAQTSDALRLFGRYCGRVFAHSEDVLALQERRTRLETDLGTLLESKLTPLSDWVTRTPTASDRVALQHRARTAVAEAQTAALSQAKRVQAPVARGLLRGFVNALARPVSPPRP